MYDDGERDTVVVPVEEGVMSVVNVLELVVAKRLTLPLVTLKRGSESPYILDVAVVTRLNAPDTGEDEDVVRVTRGANVSTTTANPVDVADVTPRRV